MTPYVKSQLDKLAARIEKLQAGDGAAPAIRLRDRLARVAQRLTRSSQG